MSKDRKFWNKVAEKYAAKPVPDEAIYEKKLQLTRDLLTSEMDVLEIGCGTGTTALKHAPYVKHIVATDFSQSMIDVANQKAKEQGVENITFKCESVETLEQSNDQFDVIMAHSILHLLPDKLSAIKQSYRLLKPGGYFISSTVCLTGFISLLKIIWPIIKPLGLVPPLYFFSEDELLDNHKLAGFEIAQQWQPSKINSFIIARKPL